MAVRSVGGKAVVVFVAFAVGLVAAMFVAVLYLAGTSQPDIAGSVLRPATHDLGPTGVTVSPPGEQGVSWCTDMSGEATAARADLIRVLRHVEASVTRAATAASPDGAARFMETTDGAAILHAIVSAANEHHEIFDRMNCAHELSPASRNVLLQATRSDTRTLSDLVDRLDGQVRSFETPFS